MSVHRSRVRTIVSATVLAALSLLATVATVLADSSGGPLPR
jgi:hypothetical protein